MKSTSSIDVINEVFVVDVVVFAAAAAAAAAAAFAAAVCVLFRLALYLYLNKSLCHGALKLDTFSCLPHLFIVSSCQMLLQFLMYTYKVVFVS